LLGVDSNLSHFQPPTFGALSCWTAQIPFPYQAPQEFPKLGLHMMMGEQSMYKAAFHNQGEKNTNFFSAGKG
jgi:hypothetical protein